MLKKATQQQTKQHNQRLVLKTIYDEEAISRANVARATNLTRTTVSTIVTGLIEDGLVAEVGLGPSQGGKPPILMSVVEDAYCVIGIDLGNSQFRGGVFDLRGRMIRWVSLPLEGRKGLDAAELLYRLIDELLGLACGSFIGIGIGTPGVTDARRGVVYEAVNLGWYDFPLKEKLEARYDLPIHIGNDSQVAALGEYTFGENQDITNLVIVKVGQGISAGIVLNGRLYLGDSSGSGEIGHLMVVEGGERCTCGHYGCLETVANSQAIIKQAKAVAQADPDSTLHRFTGSVEEIDTDVVFRAFAAGDQALEQIISQVGSYIGITVASLVSVLNIHHVVIGGRMARFGEALLEPIRQEVKQRVLQKIAGETEVVLSGLGENVVLEGAAALVLSYELGVV